LLLALGYMVYLQTRGNTVLGHHPYVSYLLPFAFLAIGVSFWPAVDDMSARAFGILCVAAAAVFAAVWFTPRGPLYTASPAVWNAALGFCGGALALALLVRRRAAGTYLALAGFAAYCALSQVQTTSQIWGFMHGDREQYQRIMQARERIENARQDSDIRFWYDKKEDTSDEFFALNGTYIAEFKRLSTDFPRGCDEPVGQGTLAVVTSRNPDMPRAAETALAPCWHRFGLNPIVEETDRVGAPQPYAIAMLRAEYDFTAIRPLTADFGPQGTGILRLVESPRWVQELPTMRWIPTGETALRDTPEGLFIQAPKEPEAYFATYTPLVAPRTGKYRFLIAYTPLSGDIFIGAAHPNRPEWVAIQRERRYAGKRWEMTMELNLDRGEAVVLRVSAATAGSPPVSIRLDQFAAFLIDR
jgi:hypothetical protein